MTVPVYTPLFLVASFLLSTSQLCHVQMELFDPFDSSDQPVPTQVIQDNQEINITCRCSPDCNTTRRILFYDNSTNNLLNESIPDDTSVYASSSKFILSLLANHSELTIQCRCDGDRPRGIGLVLNESFACIHDADCRGQKCPSHCSQKFKRHPGVCWDHGTDILDDDCRPLRDNKKITWKLQDTKNNSCDHTPVLSLRHHGSAEQRVYYFDTFVIFPEDTYNFSLANCTNGTSVSMTTNNDSNSNSDCTGWMVPNFNGRTSFAKIQVNVSAQDGHVSIFIMGISLIRGDRNKSGVSEKERTLEVCFPTLKNLTIYPAVTYPTTTNPTTTTFITTTSPTTMTTYVGTVSTTVASPTAATGPSQTSTTMETAEPTKYESTSGGPKVSTVSGSEEPTTEEKRKKEKGLDYIFIGLIIALGTVLILAFLEYFILCYVYGIRMFNFGLVAVYEPNKASLSEKVHFEPLEEKKRIKYKAEHIFDGLPKGREIAEMQMKHFMKTTDVYLLPQSQFEIQEDMQMIQFPKHGGVIPEKWSAQFPENRKPGLEPGKQVRQIIMDVSHPGQSQAGSAMSTAMSEMTAAFTADITTQDVTTFMATEDMTFTGVDTATPTEFTFQTASHEKLSSPSVSPQRRSPHSSPRRSPQRRSPHSSQQRSPQRRSPHSSQQRSPNKKSPQSPQQSPNKSPPQRSPSNNSPQKAVPIPAVQTPKKPAQTFFP